MTRTVPVLMPNGTVQTAELGGLTGDGYRYASARVTDPVLGRVRVSGRVATTDRKAIKTFEVKLGSVNAGAAFRGTNEYAI